MAKKLSYIFFLNTSANSALINVEVSFKLTYSVGIRTTELHPLPTLKEEKVTAQTQVCQWKTGI